MPTKREIEDFVRWLEDLKKKRRFDGGMARDTNLLILRSRIERSSIRAALANIKSKVNKKVVLHFLAGGKL